MAEILLAQKVHAVVMQARVHRIGHEHRVVDRRHGDAVAGEDLGVVFDVLPDLEDRRVLEHGPQHIEAGVQPHLPLGECYAPKKIVGSRGLMRQRDIAGLPRLDAKRDADKLGPHLVKARGLGIHSDIAAPADTVDPNLKGCGIGHAFIGVMVEGQRFRRLWLRDRIGPLRGLIHHRRRLDAELVGHALEYGAELHLCEEVEEGIRLGIAHFEIIEREIEGRLAIERDQPLRQLDLLAVDDKCLTALGLRDFHGAVEKALQIAKLVDEKRRRLDTDPRRAGNVIDTVARQRLHVDHPLGADAELLDHALAVDPLVLHRVEQLDPVAHKLHQVLVGADDRHSPARIPRLVREGGDDIVGLIAFDLLAGDVEGLGGAAGQRELRDQVFGRRGAVGLVFVIEVVAEGAARIVEDHRHMGRRIAARVILDIALEHIDEARHRADRQAVRLARERRQRVIGAEDKGRAVDQVQVATLAKTHRRLSRPAGAPPCAVARWPRKINAPLRRPSRERSGNRSRGIRPSPCRAGSSARRGDGPAPLRHRHRPRARFRRSWSQGLE